jgi:porphobilinogen deaminase
LATLDHASARSLTEAVLRLDGLVADVSGTRIVRKSIQGSCADPHELGLTLARSVKADGGAEILRDMREALES